MSTHPLALILHGFTCNSQSYFLPSLKQYFEERHFIAVVPDLPSPESPTLDEWVATTIHALAGQTTIDTLVAHSLGGSLALQLLSQNHVTAKKLVLLSTSIGLENVTELGSFLSPPLNNENIMANAESIISVACTDDPWIDFEHAILHTKQLKASALIMNGFGHFEIDQLPQEILSLIH